MLLLLLACHDDTSPPTVEAFRGGIGYWPENSPLAIAGVTRSALPGASFDLSLTSDGVVMVLRGPTLDPERCTWADGTPIVDAVLVAERTAHEIEREVACGGLPHPGFMNARVEPEPPSRFDAAMTLLRSSPGTRLRWMVEEPGIAEVLLSRWLALDPPNALVLSSRDPELLRSAEASFTVAGVDVTTALVGAPTDADLLDAVVFDRSAVPADLREARDLGLAVWVEAVDDPDVSLAADVISTGYPGDIP